MSFIHSFIPQYASPPTACQATLKFHPPKGYATGTFWHLFFGTDASPPLTVAIAHADVHPIAFTHFTYLIGSVSAVTTASPALVQHGTDSCLLLQCIVLGTLNTPAYAAAERTAWILNFQNAVEGFIARGAPVVTTDYISTNMEDRLITPQKKRNQIGDHALPQRGFGISTPSGVEQEGAAPNTRHRWLRKSRQRATHDPRSEHTRARRHSVVRHRSSIQENKGGKNGAYSIMPGAGTGLQERERIQDSGPRAYSARELSPNQGSTHEAPDARPRARAPHAAGGLTGPPRGQWSPGNHAGKLCN
jgi:hypothetical protein